MKKFQMPESTIYLKRNQQGFSLLEVLVSFVLVTFLITGTAQLAMHSLLIQKRADCNLKAALLASSKLEYLKSLPYESDELKAAISIEFITEEGSLKIYQREWKIENISPNMKKIEIECFAQDSPQKKMRLILFLSRELGF